MKTLQEHLSESLMVESYKVRTTPNDWDKLLKTYKPKYSNYSQLGNIENYVEDEDSNDEVLLMFMNDMFEGGVVDSQDNRIILRDIFLWIFDNYECSTFGWRDDAEEIMDEINGLKSYEWGVSMEDYAAFMHTKKNLSGTDKRFGEVLAKYAGSDDLEEIAAQYSSN